MEKRVASKSQVHFMSRLLPGDDKIYNTVEPPKILLHRKNAKVFKVLFVFILYI